MTRTKKILLGSATAWPILDFTLIFAVGILSVLLSNGGSSPIGAAVPFMLGAQILTMLLVLVLIPIYISLALHNQRISRDARLLWVALFLCAAVLAMPAYYLLYIRRSES